MLPKLNMNTNFEASKPSTISGDLATTKTTKSRQANPNQPEKQGYKIAVVKRTKPHRSIKLET